MYKMGHRCHDSFLIENRRSDACNQTTGLKVRLLKQCHSRIIHLGCQSRLRVLQVMEGLKLHDGPRQLLGQFIVNVVGDGLSLMVTGL